MNDTTKKAAISVTVDNEAQSVTFLAADGKILVVKVKELSEDIQTHAKLHGIKQKLIDAAAIARDPQTGKSATLAAKLEAIQEVLARLKKGEWNKKREGGTSEGGILLTALQRLYSHKAPEDVKNFLNSLTAQEKTAIKLTPEVADMIAIIQAERAPKGIDVNSLLSGLQAVEKAEKVAKTAKK